MAKRKPRRTLTLEELEELDPGSRKLNRLLGAGKFLGIVDNELPCFALRLQQALALRDMPLKELARITGLDYSRVWRYATGRSLPNALGLALICIALRCSPSFLVGQVDAPGPPCAETHSKRDN